MSRNKNIIIVFLTVLLFIFTSVTSWLLVDKYLPFWSPSATTEQQIEYLIKNQYLGTLPSEEKIADYKNKAMVESLEDPYSEYFTKDEAENFINSLNEEYVGVGVRFDIKNDNSVVITEVLKDSPAEKVGIQANDILLKINDKNIAEIGGVDKIIENVRGQEGSEVKLGISRNQTELNFLVTRAKFNIDNVSVVFDGEFAIIKITSFGENLGTQMNQIAHKVFAQNSKKIILDLRDNSGGLMDQAIEVLSYFVPENTLLLSEKLKTETVPYYSNKKEISLHNLPLSIIVNQGTASASEITALALKDIREAKLIGQKTYGKGVVQGMYELENGGQIKITIAQWFGPKNDSINKVGIEPDILIENNNEMLDKAKAILK